MSRRSTGTLRVQGFRLLKRTGPSLASCARNNVCLPCSPSIPSPARTYSRTHIRTCRLHSHGNAAAQYASPEDASVSAEIVQAATKWKRLALAQFECGPGEGVLCAPMLAVRKDYLLDHDHSAYVDQWDWEVR